jgi:O-acetyl-ADP-ribose deacetylase (regulator of RNase III)
MTDNVEYITGDIFTTTLPALGHGVNIDGVMGSGIAVLVRRNFPDIYSPYKEACDNKTLIAGGLQPILTDSGMWVFNMASQDRPGANARLSWLEETTEAAFIFAEQENISGFALPRIGAGVGGLKWEDVDESLNRIAALYQNVKLEIWSLPDAR